MAKVKVPPSVCRLTLEIGGVEYAVRCYRPDPGGDYEKVVRLRKRDGTAYHVGLAADRAECDCPDFVWRREGREVRGCKHVKSLYAVGLLDCAGPPMGEAAERERQAAFRSAVEMRLARA